LRGATSGVQKITTSVQRKAGWIVPARMCLLNARAVTAPHIAFDDPTLRAFSEANERHCRRRRGASKQSAAETAI
jgi:hypothetical protein